MAKMLGSNRATSGVVPVAVLVAVTAVWGSTFFLIKGLLQEISALDFLSVRFLIAALVVGVLMFPRLRRANKRTWRNGIILGILYGSAQIFQTVGLKTTHASVSGFITGMYVVLTPVALLLLFRERISRKVWFAVAIAGIGVAVLSLHGFAVGRGELITFTGSVLYAVHIVFLGRWAKQDDPFTLGLIQIIGIAVFCTVCALPTGIRLPTTVGSWAALIYMAFVAGVAALIAQTWAQARMSAPSAAIVMTMEPVFASLFAVVFGGEVVTLRLLLGGGMILTAMFTTELEFNSEVSATMPPRSLNRDSKVS
ncbi:DMT family transporter [Gleimia hominis]|uniref:DMT family transporter n=1 Tax=Gleimia hominis TaxID=595468 RepID=A0ABU3IAF0_9ACTO|nr:DMT family transporter [Gleimia hominis]MDT3766881.1 DMT family transporter [Gleimia hominis]